MTSALALIAAATMAGPVLSQTAPDAPQACLHTRTSFDLVMHAPLAETAALFGPLGERAWAGEHWDPKFIFPQPAADVEGAVFTIEHGSLSGVWVSTLRDMEAGHFQYVYFLPGLMVTMIDVRFTPTGADATAVNVIYTRTAITPEGNEHITALNEGDKRAGKAWQEAIDRYLALGKSEVKP